MVGCEVICEMLGSGAKSAMPCEDRHHRKINCSLQIAVAAKGAWWAVMCYVKLRLRCKVAPQLRFLCSAKSIAACRMHL